MQAIKYQLVRMLVALNDLEWRNSIYFAFLIALQADYIWQKLTHTGDAAVAWSLLTAKLFVIL